MTFLGGRGLVCYDNNYWTAPYFVGWERVRATTNCTKRNDEIESKMKKNRTAMRSRQESVLCGHHKTQETEEKSWGAAGQENIVWTIPA